MSTQAYLDGLEVGDEVAVDYRCSGKGSKVFRVNEIRRTEKYARVFVVRGMMFSPIGNYVPPDGHETWPGSCCLEDPDEEVLGPPPQPTRREASRRWHLRDTFGRLVSDPERMLSFEQLEKMIRVVFPDYEPKWY